MTRRSLLQLLALAALGPGLAAAETKKCTFCHSDTGVSDIQYRDKVLYPVCARCLQTLPKCSECRRPTDQKAYRDGRTLCKVCLATGIFTASQAKTLQDELQAYVKSLIGYSAPPPVQVVDKDELQTRFTAGGRSMDVAGFYRAYNPEMVYILSGKLPLEAGATLAHEYTHGWQSRNCPPQDRALTEGFASWVEYQYLLSRRASERAEQCKTSPDPDYGDSLVQLLAREKTMGRPAFLLWVRKAHDLKSA